MLRIAHGAARAIGGEGRERDATEHSGRASRGERYYDTNIMGWTQQDPLLNAGDIRQANRYTYAGDSPASLVDPDGTDILGVCSWVKTPSFEEGRGL